jgi:hypothetical protein
MDQSQKKLNIRERIFKWIFIKGDRYKLFVSWFSGFCGFINPVTFSLLILGLEFYVGFGNSPLGEKNVLVLAGKIVDIKRFVES